jgi:hypothetical protein
VRELGPHMKFLLGLSWLRPTLLLGGHSAMNSTPYEWECEFGSCPNEAKIRQKSEASYAYASSVPIHSSNGDFPTAEDGKRHLSSRVPER